MPNNTFYNLPDEKRNMIEDAAIDEFAEYGFENASVNRIVEQCGIAKGSFYQYFVDKKDLFNHIIQIIAQEKMKYVSPTMQNPEENDFFTLVKELYASGMKFATSNIKLQKIGVEIVKNFGKPIYKEVIGENVPNANNIYENLLKLAIQRGEVRTDINVKYVSFMMTALSIANFEYWMQLYENEFNFSEYSKSVMDLVEMQMDLMKNGIGTKKGEES